MRGFGPNFEYLVENDDDVLAGAHAVNKVYDFDTEIHRHADLGPELAGRPAVGGTVRRFSVYRNNMNHDEFTAGIHALTNKHLPGNNLQYKSVGADHHQMISQLPVGKQTYITDVETKSDDHPLNPRKYTHFVNTWFSD